MSHLWASVCHLQNGDHIPASAVNTAVDTTVDTTVDTVVDTAVDTTDWQ